MDIVILEPAKLGDFIQSSPLVNEIIKAHPHSEIRLAALDSSVIEMAGLIFPEIKTVALEANLQGGAKLLGKGADLVINLSLAPRVLNFLEDLKPQKIIGPQLVKGKLSLPVAQKLAMCAMTLGRRMGRLNLVDIWRSFYPKSDPRLIAPKGTHMDPQKGLIDAKIIQIDDNVPTMAFHLGAGNHLRRWPVENHVKLAEILYSKYPFRAVLIGTRPEEALARKFMALYKELVPGSEVINLVGKTSLKDLASLISTLKLLVSSDTGIMHLAASYGIKQLSIFCGPALAHETGPYNKNAYVLQGLAPCGPCTENLGCHRRQCRAIPQPSAAAFLAFEALGMPKIFEKDLDPLDGDKGIVVESYRAELDSFGFKLVPHGPFRARLNSNNILGISFREGARSVIYKDYENLLADKREEILKKELDKYLRAQDDTHSFGNKKFFQTLRYIAKNAFEDSRLKDIFQKNSKLLLDSLLPEKTHFKEVLP
ncbi:MAG: glycosyltransferase family 9 protein [Deltaproteobacteria bacterium]|jgi:ADP-heptose:LPS heptosyltransferase|nr:glycosyltransferase family 9 protein [Deltaproteobacteria bacterium]